MFTIILHKDQGNKTGTKGGALLEDQSVNINKLHVIADEVIDVLRPKGLTFADVRYVLKVIDENLEFERLGEKQA